MLLGVYHMAQAQKQLEAKYVTQAGDTIPGTISANANPLTRNFLKFTRSDSNKVIRITPAGTKALLVGETIYLQVQIPHEDERLSVYREVLIDGMMSLSEAKSPIGSSIFFLQRHDADKPIMLNSDEKILENMLRSVLSDCKALDYKGLFYNRQYFVKLLKKYNECVSSEDVKISESASRKRAKPRVALLLGFNYADFRYPSEGTALSRVDFQPEVSPLFGAMADIPLSKLLSLRLGLHYEHLKATARDLQSLSAGRLDMDMKYLNVPISLQANFSTGIPFEPYVNGGVSMGALMSNDAKFYDGNGNPLPQRLYLEDQKFGFHIGGGSRYMLGNRTFLFLELRASLGFTNMTTAQEENQINTLTMQFIGGFGF